MSNFVVYRHFDRNGVLLYIGVSTDPQRRLLEHSSRSHWFSEIATMTVSKRKYRHRMDALAAESRAIHKENPKFNIAWNWKLLQMERFVNGGEGDCNVKAALAMAIEKAGSQLKLAKAIGVSAPFMCDVAKGNRRISDKVAEHLGFPKLDRLSIVSTGKMTPMPAMYFEDVNCN